MKVTSQTTKAVVKKVHRRTCKNVDCKTKFTTTDSRKCYCSQNCQAVKHITAKRSATYQIPKTNHFFVYLTKEVLRSNTLHVLDPLVGSVEALQALYEIVKGRMVANVLSGKELFHVGHVAPSKHEYVLGMLCAENLLVVPASLNKRHANNHANKAGVFMYRADMIIRNTILPDDLDVLDRVIEYIGLDTVIAFCKKSHLAPSQRQAAIKKLAALIDNANPDHKQFVALLADKDAKTPAIHAAIEAINGAKEFKPMMKGQRLSESAMLVKELIRHAEFRYELEECAAIARQYTREDFSHTSLSNDAQRTLFKLLHGYLEPEMENEVDCLMYELRAPLRAKDARTAAIEVRMQEHAREAAERIAYQQSPAAQWNFAQFEADVIDTTDYCLIPYMARPVLVNVHIPTITPPGECPF